ncbi:hypothetical protein N9H22_01030 [Opitutales bacterium]|nr:hypothetical protein [Opitutales bacterium]MDB3959068.1 hypothetical protein [Opitutales bacterium]
MHDLRLIGITFLGIILLFTSCRKSSVTSIPNAPPPYPSFPVPQERYQSSQVYGGQPSNSTYIPPYSEPTNYQKSVSSENQSFYTPPPAVPPRQRIYKNPTLQSQPYPRQGQETNSARFTLEAKADLWALVQDDKGAELQWLKMKPGETSTISHSGDLTITCSSGDKLLIKDKFGKKIETNPNASGISIVRLAAN